MSMPDDSVREGDAKIFNSTHWSVVLSAAGSSPEAEAAWKKLHAAYHRPLYFYLRRKGSDPEQAEDLVQSLFAKLWEKGLLGAASQSRGKFRGFLLTTLRNLKNDEWDKAQTRKRGGGQSTLSSSDPEVEKAYLRVADDSKSPEELYEQQWVRTIFERTDQRLANKCAAQGKSKQYEALKVGLSFEPDDVSIDKIARELGITSGAAKTALSRFRKQFRELLRDEISQTVHSPEDFREEMQHLLSTIV